MAGQLSRIEVRSAAGTLYGVIRSATRWTNRLVLDAAGTFGFEMPLGDPQAVLVQDKRYVWAYAVQQHVDTLIGAGVIESFSFALSDGAPVLRVEGDDLLSELADMPAGVLELYTTEERTSDYVLLWTDGATYTNWSTRLCDGLVNSHYSETLGPNDAILICDTADVFDRIEIGFDGYWNGDAATVTLQYWDGSDWADTEIISDSMNVNGVPFAQDGVIRFERHSDWATATIDGKTGYWLKLSVSENMDNASDPAWGYINVIEELPDPTPLANVFALSVVTAKGWALDTDYYDEAESGYYGRFVNGESVLQVLRAIAEQTGEHFRLGSGRQIQWLGDDQTAAPVRAVRATGSPRLSDNDDVAVIAGLNWQSDSYELVTRVYPYGATRDIDLSECTRTAPSGYTLDTANNCIVSTAQETALGGYRCDRTVQWSQVRSVVDNVTIDPNASDALYDLALAWLQAHDAATIAVEVRLLKVAQAILPGQQLTVDYHQWLAGRDVVDLADAFWVQEVVNTIDGSGRWECTPRLGSSAYRAAADSEVVADLVKAVDDLYRSGAGASSVTVVAASSSGGTVEQGCRVYRSSTQSISHNSLTAVAFDSEVHDTDGCWASSDATKLYAQHAGYYLAGGQITMQMGAAGAEVLAVIIAGGSTYLASQQINVAAGKYVSVTPMTGMFWLDVGGYVELHVRQIQDSGSTAVNLLAASGTYQQFNHAWLMRVA